MRARQLYYLSQDRGVIVLADRQVRDTADPDADIYKQFQKRKTSCPLKIAGTLRGVFEIDLEMNLQG